MTDVWVQPIRSAPRDGSEIVGYVYDHGTKTWRKHTICWALHIEEWWDVNNDAPMHDFVEWWAPCYPDPPRAGYPGG